MQEKQKRTHVHSATFWRIFANYAAPALLLILAAFLLMFARRANERRAEQRLRCLEAADSIAQTVEDLLAERILLRDELHATYWVQRQMLEENTLEEFSPLEMKHNTESAGLKCNAYTAEKNVFLYFPGRNQWCAYHTWAGTRDYMGILGVRAQYQEQFIREIISSERMKLVSAPPQSAIEDCLVLSLPLERMPDARGFVVFALDRERLIRSLKTQMPEMMAGLRIVGLGKEVIVSIGEMGAKTESVTLKSAYMDWRYEFFIDPSLSTHSAQGIQSNVILALSMLLLSLAIFYQVAMHVYKPLGRLAMDLAGEKRRMKQDDYQLIGQSIRQLRTQVETEKQISTWQSLLLGHFEEEKEAAEWSGLPFKEDMWFQVLLINEKEDEVLCVLGDALEIINQYEGVYCAKMALRNRGILILGFEDKATGWKDGRAILSRLKEKGLPVIAGKLRQGFAGISISYQSCQSEQRQEASVRYFLPLQWENQLISAVSSGNGEVAGKICVALRQENEHRLRNGTMGEEHILELQQTLMSDLYRAAQESGMDMDKLTAELEAVRGWDRIDAIVSKICRYAGLDWQAERGPGVKLVEYINEHFSDPSLSLTELEERFRLSHETINKYMKEETGGSFLAYLTACRIGRAKELLCQGHPVAETSQLCGYASENTFRKVFYRVVGIRAQDYADHQQAE